MGLAIGNDVSKITLGGQVLYDRDNQWKVTTGSSEALSSYMMIYRTNREERYIEMAMGGTLNQGSGARLLIDLSTLIDGEITRGFSIVGGSAGRTVVVTPSGANILTTASTVDGFSKGYNIVSMGQNGTPFVKIYYK